MRSVRIANAHGFWGDDSGAAARLAEADPTLDYITLDYLAEVSMSILAKQRAREPDRGYARDFLQVVASLTPFWRERRSPRLISNAGGLNPYACAIACQQVLREQGCGQIRIAVVTGDDVLPLILEDLDRHPNQTHFAHLETTESIGSVRHSLVTANAYLGAQPIADALHAGADIVITGRVADPSLTVGPCIAHFNWHPDDYAQLAGATVAGHLIECGTQVTGGISTDWLDLPDPANIGFPIVEVAEDGACVVTKPPGTGGRVTERTVKEQLLYEIGDPENYLSPDATVSFLQLHVKQSAARGASSTGATRPLTPSTGTPGETAQTRLSTAAAAPASDRVEVSGALGRRPPDRYKVSATYRAGYRASGMLAIFGPHAVAKARRCGEIVLDRLRRGGETPRRCLVECLGAGDVAPVIPAQESHETVLRISVADARREVVERFTREITPLITSGPQGVTGYGEGRPAVHECFGYWPTLIDRARVHPLVRILE